MIKEEVKTMPVLNPFSGETEDLLCKFQLHFNLRNKLDGVCLEAIISEAGLNLMDRLKPERTESIENDFVEAYDG